jgi:hypothetical protein
MEALIKIAKKLNEASRRYFWNPYPMINWPETIEGDHWFTSEDLISLSGTGVYDRLDESRKKKLSFLEAVNFYSLNIHGERALMEGLAHRLYRKNPPEVSAYLHHFLDEENKHMIFFGTFCTRYAGKVYPDRKIVFPREYEPGEEDFLFFVKVLVFEEIVDVFNVTQSEDANLHTIARQINQMHHQDEMRHLVFGRAIVDELFQKYSPTWKPETLEAIRDYLPDYIRATWKEYYNADVYRDLGLSDPHDVQEKALESPATQARRQRISQPLIKFLLSKKILLEEPVL